MCVIGSMLLGCNVVVGVMDVNVYIGCLERGVIDKFANTKNQDSIFLLVCFSGF